MALITRVSRLFRADVHAVLDRIEEPDVLLRQAVREMEEALTGDEQSARLLRHEHRQLAARADDLARALAEVDEELDVCFGSGKDDLARALVRRKLEAERLGKTVARRRAALVDSLDALDSRIAENRARLDRMREKAAVLAEETRGSAPVEEWRGPGESVVDADVEIAFLREKQRRARS